MKSVDRDLIRVALGQSPAKTAIVGGSIVDVFSGRLMKADVTIAKGRIAVVGDIDHTIGPETEIVDASGHTLVPGLIDCHVHPEVSKLSTNRFIDIALLHGTTSIMTGLDDFAVVGGLENVRLVLDYVQTTPFKIYYSPPSRLPYTTPASTIPRSLGAEEQKQALAWEETVGIWEYMIESIEELEQPVLDAANQLYETRRRPRGHLPLVQGLRLNVGVAAGARDDHESWSAEEVVEKLRFGVNVFLRKASGVDNIKDCIKVITEKGLPSGHISLCTDDVDCTDLTELGYADHLVRYAIELGVDPIHAIQMCTINPAKAYGLEHTVGSIAPGRAADMILVGDLPSFDIKQVFANGILVAREGKSMLNMEPPNYPPELLHTMHATRKITEEDLFLTAGEGARKAEVIVMHIEPSQLRTRRGMTLPVEDGRILPDPAQSVNYVTVTDRHSGELKSASAFISGFGLKKGAFATSLSPDDHNIICIGACVPDMVVAINRLLDLEGGQVVVADSSIVEEIRLPICGLMADISAEEMATKEHKMRNALFDMGVDIPRPFFTILFLSITAIPNWSITDQGLVNYDSREYVDPVLSWS